MYEDITSEVILERMLDRISDDFDKREGSIIYDALAPAAIELENMYFAFDSMLQETFGDTASRDYLIRLALERGLQPYPATKAIVKGIFTPAEIDIEIGERFSCDVTNYVITEKISDGIYKLECEDAGSIGNDYTGTIIPIDYIEGLETANVGEIIIVGQDEEETEHFRTRYLNSFNERAFSGNKRDYIEKGEAIAGVSSLKVEPCFDGVGTVRLTILNAAYDAASDELVQLVQKTFDPNGDGMGDGLAPIGHTVTVRSAGTTEVNVSIDVTFDSGYSWETHRSQIEDVIKGYLLELRKSWAEEGELIVRISLIEARVLNIEGVVDVANTTINGEASNLTVDSYSVPTFGGVN